jgi:hypothetical protein
MRRMLRRTFLEGVLLSAMVWRARGRPNRPTVNLAENVKLDPDTMLWTTTNSTFAAWRDRVLETIPARQRNQALQRRSVLDPAAEEPKDVIKAQFWNEAFSAPPQGEGREKQLAALGCSSDGAPYVARSLIRNVLLLRILPVLPPPTPSQVAALADRLYKGKSNPTACPGVKGFTDEDWANLSKLSPDPHIM